MKCECYYVDFSECGCSASPYCGKTCPGKDKCEWFISENDYFERMMNGTLPEVKQQAEDPKKRQERINKNLSLGKSKKQLKYERRQEEEKNGTGSGFQLKDDPAFKDLLQSFSAKSSGSDKPKK